MMAGFAGSARAAEIPLPEHPRPDFQRPAWQNLNGAWGFRFDKANAGVGAGWAEGKTAFPLTITVPFGWGSALSGVKNEADIGSRQPAASATLAAGWRVNRSLV